MLGSCKTLLSSPLLMTFFVITLALNFKDAWKHPLPSVCFNLLKTNGSNIFVEVTWENKDPWKENTSNFVDLIGVMWVVAAIPEKCEDLAISWYRFYLPKGYLRADLASDCYFENSIKAVEKAKTDSRTLIIIKSPKLKVLKDFSNF